MQLHHIGGCRNPGTSHGYRSTIPNRLFPDRFVINIQPFGSDDIMRFEIARAAAKTAETLKIPATNTERCQTTVPAAIRKMPALGKRDQGCFVSSPDGTVVIAKKEPRADDGDPVIGRCLAFLARDMAIEPARIRPVPRSLVLRGKALVKGVRIDLDAPLSDDKA